MSDTLNSFWNHLDNNRNGIVVPIIQRDYAQGRRNNSKADKIRKKLLMDLYNAIPDKPICLDFVYGSINVDGKINLIDGQQRFTTLFLLHFYFACKLNKDDEEIDQSIRSVLTGFSYETRTSSTEFCKMLCSINCKELWNKISNQNNFETALKDMTWFRKSWSNDPTVDAMLNMLNDIHNIFSSYDDTDNIKKLFGNNSPILIHLKEINDFSDAEDLYIKMNARGKALTDFENFKAQFGGHINELCEHKKFIDITENDFWTKIDGVCSDFMWEFIQHRYDDFGIFDNYVYRCDNALLAYIWIQVEMYSFLSNKDIKKNDKIDLDFYKDNEMGKNFPLVSFEWIKKVIDNTANTNNKVRDWSNLTIHNFTPEELIVKSLINIRDIMNCVSKVFDGQHDCLREDVKCDNIELWKNSSIFKCIFPLETMKNGIINTEWPDGDYISKILFFSVILWCSLFGVPTDTNILKPYLVLIRNILKRYRSKKSGARSWDPELGKYECGTIIDYIVNVLFSFEKETPPEKYTADILNKDYSKYPTYIKSAVEQEIFILNLPEKDAVNCRKLENLSLFSGEIYPIISTSNVFYSNAELIRSIFYPEIEPNKFDEYFISLSKALISISDDKKYFRIPSGESCNNDVRISFCDVPGKSFDSWSLSFLYNNYQDSNKSGEQIRKDNIDLFETLINRINESNGETIEDKIRSIIINTDDCVTKDWRYYFIKYGDYIFKSKNKVLFNNGKKQLHFPTIEFSPSTIGLFGCTTSYNQVRFLSEAKANVFLIMAASRLCEDKGVNVTEFFKCGWSSTSPAIFNNNDKRINAYYDETSCGFVINDNYIKCEESTDMVETLIANITLELCL